MQLLHVDSSVTGEQSVSRQLTRQIVDFWVAQYPGTEVIYLDLAVDTPAHFTPDFFAPAAHSEHRLTERQIREIALSEQLVTQFLAADVVVIGAPLYNFSIPTQLKSWLDRLAMQGRTFRYTVNGSEGLTNSKVVIVASSRGGIYSTTEAGRDTEHQESYLKVMLGFFGITDIRFVRAEGTAMGPEARAWALTNAAQEIGAVIVPRKPEPDELRSKLAKLLSED